MRCEEKIEYMREVCARIRPVPADEETVEAIHRELARCDVHRSLDDDAEPA